MADRAAANVCLANLTVALELAHAGIPIFPARITTRFNSWEKSPLVKRWQEAATTDEIQVRSWWKQFPVAVPGIELGRAGLVVIDPDRHGKAVDGVEAFAQLATDIGGLPVHPTTDTPSGHHHIFRQNGGEPLGNSPGGLPRSVDVRGNGGWIVGPGSVRSDGAVYRPHAGTPSLTQAYKVDTIPALPAALDAIIRQPDPGRVRERNTRPNRHGFVFHDGPVDIDAAFAAMAYESKGGNGVNATVCRVIPSLLRKAEHPDDVLARVVDEVMRVAKRQGLQWNRQEETKLTVKRILSAYHNLLLKDYEPVKEEVPGWLPGDFHLPWAEALAATGRPHFGCNARGFYIRGRERPKGTGPAKAARAAEQKVDYSTANDPAKKYRFPLLRFDAMRPGVEPDYLVDELIPAAGLVLVYGAPKSGKSFWVLDLVLHIVLAWEYRDRSVQQGTAVYCAFEGAHGYRKRCEAFRRHYGLTDENPPLYIVPGRTDLIKDHAALIRDIRAQLAEQDMANRPVRVVVLDTLNRSLIGSESKDVDMANYLTAAEAIQKAFGGVVIIVHHHGIDETRPRGHTSLRGAVAAQLKVTRGDVDNLITVEIEDMRDGPEGAIIVSRLQVVDVATDRAGKTITSAVIEPAQGPPPPRIPKLTKKQRIMLAVLQDAGEGGLTTDEWYERARKEGVGATRRSDLFDIRMALKSRKLVSQLGNRWKALV